MLAKDVIIEKDASKLDDFCEISVSISAAGKTEICLCAKKNIWEPCVTFGSFLSNSLRNRLVLSIVMENLNFHESLPTC